MSGKQKVFEAIVAPLRVDCHDVMLRLLNRETETNSGFQEHTHHMLSSCFQEVMRQACEGGLSHTRCLSPDWMILNLGFILDKSVSICGCTLMTATVTCLCTHERRSVYLKLLF